MPNFRQGEIHGSAPGMIYRVDGTWSAGGRTGTCSGHRTATRIVTGLFTRHSTQTAPPPATGYGKWTLFGPPALDCPFMAAANDGSGLLSRHLRGYALGYPGVETPVAKSALLRARVVVLPVHVRGNGHARPGELTDLWSDGAVKASLTVDGTVTLTRFSTCRFLAGTDGWRRCKPYQCPESEVRRHLAGASPRLAPAGDLASTPGTSQAAGERQPRRCIPQCACELATRNTSCHIRGGFSVLRV